MSDEEPESRQSTPRRRPGRFRRWFLRPAMWALAALALLLFVMHAALQSAWAGAYFAGILENGLEELLDRKVWVGSVHLKLLPLGVEIGDLRLAGPTAEDPPVVTVRRVVIDAELIDLQRRELTLHEVILEEPRLYLDFSEAGGNNFPKLAGRRRAGEGVRAPLRVKVRHLAIAGGELRLQQQRLPLELEADALNAELSGGRGQELTGRLVSGALRVQLPRAQPVSAAVGVRLVIGPEGLQVLSGRVGAPDLTAALTGYASWPDKEWVFEVKGHGETSFFQRLGYLQDQIVGPFEVDGGFAWRERSWGYRAQLTSPQLQVFDRQIRDFQSAVSGDRNGVRFDIERAQYARGLLRGVIHVETEGGQRGFEADLLLDELDLQQVVDDQNLPVEGLAGRVSGVFNYRFPFGASSEGQGWADLRVAAELNPGRQAIPLTGSVPLLIERGVIHTRAARLEGPYERVAATGFFDIESRRGRFDYRIATRRVQRLALLVPLQNEEDLLWMPTSGAGTLEGTLTLEPGRPSTRLHLDLQEVVAPGATAERVQGTLAIGMAGLEDMRLELLRPEGGLIVTGSVPFDRASGQQPWEVPFSLAIDAVGWPLAEARPWLPMALPVDGLVSGSMLLWGQPNDPDGRLRAILSPANLGDLGFDELALRLDVEPGQLRVEHLGVRVPAGEISLSGSVNRRDETLDLELRSLPLRMDAEPFTALMPGGLSGELLLAGTVMGAIDQPRLDATLEWRNLEIGGRVLGREGGATVQLTMAGERLEAEGELLGLIHMAGGGRLDRSGFDLRLELSTSVLDELILLTGTDAIPDSTGEARGALTATGSFSGDPQWSAALELDRFQMTYRGLELQNLEPVAISLDEVGLLVESFYIGEPAGDSELFLNGSVRLDAGRSLDLRMQSSLDTQWLELVLPDLGLRSGRFEFLATVQGDLAQPVVNGQGRLSDGRVVLPELPFSIDAIDGILLFEPDQIFVDTVTAEAAGGTLLASGTIRSFAGSKEPEYRLQVAARDLSLAFPENWTSRGDADLILASNAEGQQIRGSVEIKRALYVQDLTLSLPQMLQGLFVRRRLEVERADDIAAAWDLNIAVRGPGAVRVRNNLADLHGDLDLIVRGTLSRPVVFGEVKLQRGGKLVLGPNEYVIERGTLRFSNPLKIEPVIDVVARADVREYDITLNLAGTLDRLNATYSSNPPLADLEILSLLATGEENWAASSSPEAAASEESLSASNLLYGQAASLVAQRTGQLFGLDRFRVQPLTSSSGDLSSARVTVGKQLSRDVYVTYSYDPATAAEQIFEIEWQVARGMTLLLRQNGDESYGVDVVFKNSF